eukprot:263246_1
MFVSLQKNNLRNLCLTANHFRIMFHKAPPLIHRGLLVLPKLHYHAQLNGQSHFQFNVADNNDYNDQITHIRTVLHKSPLNHIGLIPDGNRRWAKQNGLTKKEGHDIGFENAFHLLNNIFDIGSIHSATMFGCSTDNFFKRDSVEIRNVFDALNQFMLTFLEHSAPKYGVKMNHLGDKNILPGDVTEVINYVEEKSNNYENHLLNMCIAYDGVAEICLAINKLSEDEIKNIDAAVLMKYLYKHQVKYPDIDFVIRPGKVQRLSKFMTLQSANAEYYFPDEYFPEFGQAGLFTAIEKYCDVTRRFGQ